MTRLSSPKWTSWTIQGWIGDIQRRARGRDCDYQFGIVDKVETLNDSVQVTTLDYGQVCPSGKSAKIVTG